MASADLQEVCSAVEMACKETSPDSKCPICLDRFNNVSYADSCFHRFCFCCILEWGKNKAECPLCKQPFSAVYHSVCSEVDFRLYKLPPVKNGSFGDVQGRRFRYRTTMTHRRRTQGRTWEGSRSQELLHFRRWLYRHDMRVRCVRDAGRSRNTSAEFFRKNPACLHRLVPWLKRELSVLCGSHDSRTDVILHAILSLITRYDMQDEAFLQKLRPFLSTRTEHFLHEFLSFAKSPFNMEAYDRHAVYDCPAPSRLSAVSEDDADLSSAPSPWDDETPGPSYSTATQPVYSVTISDSDVDSASEEEEEEVTESVHANANVNDSYAQVDEDDSSSDEDCVIIGFIKPTTQRTPELVQLTSDSEVSVKEEPEPSTSIQCEKSRRRSREKSRRTSRRTSREKSRRRSREKSREKSRERSRRTSRERSRRRSRERSRRTSRERSRRRSREKSREKSRRRSREKSRERSRRTSRERSRRRSRESHMWRSCSLIYKGRSKATNHSTLSHTSQHRHSRYTDTQPSHTRSRSKTHSHSRSRRRLLSQFTTYARSGSRARARSYSGSWRIQVSARDRKCSESLSLNPSPFSHRWSSYDAHRGEKKHKSLHGDKRRRGKEKHHHHSKKKKKKKQRRRSSSMEVSAERKKHHKKKTPHKTARSRSEQTGRSSEATSPAVITIHTDTEATPPRGAAPTNTE